MYCVLRGGIGIKKPVAAVNSRTIGAVDFPVHVMGFKCPCVLERKMSCSLMHEDTGQKVVYL